MKRINISLMAFALVSFFSSNIFSQYENIRVDGPQSSWPEEVTIAINPLNPNVLAAGANIDHFYVSTDAGNTWDESHLVSTLLGVWGDPVVMFDSLGNLYYGHLSDPVSGWWIDRIVVQKSTNNGQTWNDGAGIGLNAYPKQQDKEWLAVDHTQSPYRGSIYVTWTEFDEYGSSSPSDSSRIRFSKSIDQGITWSDAKTISDVSGNCIDEDNTTEGAVPCVGPNGEIYVSWAGPLGLMFDKSTDGGETWGTDIFISDIPGGWDFAIPGISRCNGLPITMCDISNSPYRDYVYSVWSDQRNGATNTDIFLAKSTDGGNTWSAPIKVNDDATTRHQFFVWSTIDPMTGHLWLTFYDRRNTTGNATDVFVARSTDGGETFENFKVSETSFIPSSYIFFGDYTNIAAWEGKIYPIWMRLHNDELSVWIAPVIDSTTVPVELVHFSAQVEKQSVILNWQTVTETNNQGFVIERKLITNDIKNQEWIEVGFVEGNGTTTKEHQYTFSDKLYLSGTYRYRLKQVDFDGSYDVSNEIEVNYYFVENYLLSQNYPNPFNPTTTISFQLPEPTFVILKVYDALGSEVETLVEKIMPAGVHEVNFDSGNLSSGLYLYRMSTAKYEATRKMLILK